MDEIRYHKPVLVNEVLQYLNPQPNKLYIDATFGGGGHTRAILEKEPKCSVISLDWDTKAIEINAPPLIEQFPDRLKVLWGNFSLISKILKKEGIESVDGILADFGTSQYQITERSGFSFAKDTYLDMRMSPAHQKLTAAEVINKSTDAKLYEIFSELGEERFSRQIARAIVEERKKERITTTKQLVKIIEKAVPLKHAKIHPATRVFQALRIFVNKELDNIKSFLTASKGLLNDDGRLVCISFHSLEDRIVKQFFNDNECGYFNKSSCFEVLTPKVITATEEELAINPSSRSAKLRAGQFYNIFKE